MKRSFAAFAGRVVVIHTLTYILASVGVIYLIESAAELQGVAGGLFREPDSPWRFAGPFIQPVRGLLLALVLWPVWDFFVTRKLGWLRLWLLLVGVGVIASPVAGPASIEGFLRTVSSLDLHIVALPEFIIQTLAFSLLLVVWDRVSLRRELAADEKGIPAHTRGGSRYALVAAMGYVGVAIGGFLIIAASPAVSFQALSADASIQLFNVGLVIVNFLLAHLFAARLFVPEKRSTGIFSAASLFALVIIFLINTGGAALYDTLADAPMPTWLVVSVYAVSSLLLWISAVTLLPGVKTRKQQRVQQEQSGEADKEVEGELEPAEEDKRADENK